MRVTAILIVLSLSVRGLVVLRFSAKILIVLRNSTSILIVLGLLLGTVLGVFVSQQFIPFLQVGNNGDLAPPYLVEVAWEAIGQVYILFGLFFMVALVSLTWRLSRVKLFESIKLGETI